MDKPVNCWQITFEAKEIIDETLQEFFDEYFDVVACNYVEELEEYVGYQSKPFNKDDFEEKAELCGIKLPLYKVEQLENKNWLKETVIQFEPIDVEDFLIYGVHEKQPPKTNKIPIKVFAATAFGSSHQTTVGCLEAISCLNKSKINPKAILDVGTGSGILSLACAKLWPKSTVIAVDIDPESVRVTKENANDNKILNLKAELSNGYSAEIVGKHSPYDIIIANILARPLIEMREDLYANLSNDGHCILSGFNIDQEEWVVGSHKELGLEHIKTIYNDNWCVAVMRKK